MDIKRIILMNTQSPYGAGNTIAFLFGAIFNILANLQYFSLLDYTLKAFIGGIVWLGFKLLGDHLSTRYKPGFKATRFSTTSKTPAASKTKAPKKDDQK